MFSQEFFNSMELLIDFAMKEGGKLAWGPANLVQSEVNRIAEQIKILQEKKDKKEDRPGAK